MPRALPHRTTTYLRSGTEAHLAPLGLAAGWTQSPHTMNQKGTCQCRRCVTTL